MSGESSRDKAKRFTLAGLSNMTAQTITHPIDVIKIRMQCQVEGGSRRTYRNMFSGLHLIAEKEGIRVLWGAGLLAALLREASFSTIRLGGYEEVKQWLEPGQHKTSIKFRTKILSGMCSGSLAALLTTPTDVVKVRLQSDQGRSYPTTMKLFAKIWREEGIRKGLWKGTQPNVIRAMIGTSVQVSSYDHTKNMLILYDVMEEGPLLHFISSSIAGFCTATAYNPVDVVKSRMQAERSMTSAPRYKNTLQTLALIAREEGFRGWYKGWLPCWCRIAPHTCITFLVFEQLRVLAHLQPI